MRFALLGAAGLAALAAGTASSEASASCSLAAARQALGAGRVKVPALDGKNRPPVQVGRADAVICFDFTRDGHVDMAVTIASGGTAGDIAFVVFRATPAGWQVVLERGGYKLGLARVGGDLVQTQPVYRKSDPNCCPTGGFDHDRWHWDGTRFAIVRSWHDKRFKV